MFYVLIKTDVCLVDLVEFVLYKQFSTLTGSFNELNLTI